MRLLEAQIKCPIDGSVHNAIIHFSANDEQFPYLAECRKSSGCEMCSRCLTAVKLAYFRGSCSAMPLDPLSLQEWQER